MPHSPAPTRTPIAKAAKTIPITGPVGTAETRSDTVEQAQWPPGDTEATTERYSLLCSGSGPANGGRLRLLVLWSVAGASDLIGWVTTMGLASEGSEEQPSLTTVQKRDCLGSDRGETTQDFTSTTVDTAVRRDDTGADPPLLVALGGEELQKEEHGRRRSSGCRKASRSRIGPRTFGCPGDRPSRRCVHANVGKPGQRGGRRGRAAELRAETGNRRLHICVANDGVKGPRVHRCLTRRPSGLVDFLSVSLRARMARGASLQSNTWPQRSRGLKRFRRSQEKTLSPTGNDWKHQQEVTPVGLSLARRVSQSHGGHWDGRALEGENRREMTSLSQKSFFLTLRREDLQDAAVGAHAEASVLTLHRETFPASSSCSVSGVQPPPRPTLLGPGRPRDCGVHRCGGVGVWGRRLTDV
ncbi:hypothetical protein EYF80_031940 [Liparis tanakae]|uniref:Uncharacterized protein n=1 Tax=Liparis tanakae TaxID=230148 RepID=A0A4Z2GW98_9TELE|nr:hypothetical protein EYF80_031940 [Liparis tanakae]